VIFPARIPSRSLMILLLDLLILPQGPVDEPVQIAAIFAVGVSPADFLPTGSEFAVTSHSSTPSFKPPSSHV
jgi:hypothetical protein